MAKDYYKILGVGRNATAEEIKAAFRRLAHEHHPDKGGEAHKFKEANEAHQVLSDPEKRKRYDQFGTADEQQFGGGGGPFGGGFDFSGFEDLFNFGGGGRRGQRSRAQRGKDIEMDVTISLKEAATGINRSIELYKLVSCERCGGSGAEPGSKQKTCGTCGGSGEVTQTQRTFFGNFAVRQTCSACGGEGKEVGTKCDKCDGVGAARERKKFEVNIPAGIDDGEVVRLTGAGEAGLRGGRTGDLYLRVRVTPDPRFERNGATLHRRQPISFVVASLGGIVSVPTIDGEVELKIPAGTDSGAVFRLKGKGMPTVSSAKRGDELVEVFIEAPKHLSKKQKELLRELGL